MKISEEELVTALRTSLSEMTSRSMSGRAMLKLKLNLDHLDRLGAIKLMLELSIGIKLYIKEPKQRQACINKLVKLFELPSTWEQEYSQVVETASKPAWKASVSSPAPPKSYFALSSVPAKSISLSSMAPVAIDEVKILGVLGEFLSSIISKSVWKKSLAFANVHLDNLKRGDTKRLLKELQHGIRLYIRDSNDRKLCATKLRSVLLAGLDTSQSEKPVTIHVKKEIDIVTARNAGLDLCQGLGFSKTEQIKIVTAISELTRNIVQYAGYGQVRICAIGKTRKGIEVIATDDGPGIPNLDEILSGEYVSKRGMGKGIVGTKNLMDFFDIKTKKGEGTTVTTRKFLEKQWI